MVAKRLGWILLGIVIGIGITMAPRVRAQERASQPQNLIPHPIINLGNGAVGFFVGDPKTHACWLAVTGHEAITAIAPAPPEACQ
jgi:hypothetical protein